MARDSIGLVIECKGTLTIAVKAFCMQPDECA